MKLTLDGADGADRFNIGDAVSGRSSVRAIRGDLTILGGGGSDEIVFDDNGSTHDTTWVVRDDSVQHIADGFDRLPDGTFYQWVDNQTFDLNGIEKVAIFGGGGSPFIAAPRGQRYELHNSLLGLFISGGRGDDVYVIGDETAGLDELGTDFNVSIGDRGGRDLLILNDRGSSAHNQSGLPADFNYTVDDQRLMRDVTEYFFNEDGQPDSTRYHFEVKYGGMDDVRLYGTTAAPADYRISGFTGSSANSLLSIFSGPGDDTVTLGAYAAGFSKFSGPVNPISIFRRPVNLLDVGGTDHLTVYNRTIYLDAGTITAPGGFAATYAGFDGLLVNAPPGNSYVEVRGLSENMPTTIFGAAAVKLGTGNLAAIKSNIDVRSDLGIVVTGERGQPDHPAHHRRLAQPRARDLSPRPGLVRRDLVRWRLRRDAWGVDPAVDRLPRWVGRQHRHARGHGGVRHHPQHGDRRGHSQRRDDAK